MIARPILFSGEMVRALLAGRKTQTRRVLRRQPERIGELLKWEGFEVTESDGFAEQIVEDCPHGYFGDLLWVRESIFQFGGAIEYAADAGAPSFKRRMTPSIHMPKWASRLTLKITDIRVERLQDITPEDAAAEGWPYEGVRDVPLRDAYPIGWYANLWDRINGDTGPASWSENPWVWALTFTIVKRNVDQLLKAAA